jgi:hypothetical protein
MEFDLEVAATFFDFLGQHGVEWFFIEAQSRKLDGQRGAPLGQFFGRKFATNFQKCPAGFATLIGRLQRVGKKKFDLQTRESPSRLGARLVLIDDLMEHSIKQLIHWWSGPMVVMETSPSNFQALLVSQRPLPTSEQFLLQKMLAVKFEGDYGATGSGQLHRLPGSTNFKKSALIDGRPFCCKLTLLSEGEDCQVDQFSELLKSATAPPPAPHNLTQPCLPPRVVGDAATGKDNSAAAFRWTVQQLKKGAKEESILMALSTTYLAHHDPRDWPKRTLHNAKFSLGMAPNRYHAGDSSGKV